MASENDLARARQRDALCDAFEKNWRADQLADFQSFLSQVYVDDQMELLRQLLAVEVELRINSGAEVVPAAYKSIHPDAPDIVQDCLSHDPNCGEQTRAFVDTDADTKKIEIESIGPYRLVKKIGEGGMGSVYLAKQEHPIRRQVALKVIKAGGSSKEIFVRFEAERQALALMNHPNIARILDAGTTPDQRPFFAMELVQGSPLTNYCDDHQMGVGDRLRLFTDVCAGVMHAHQKGIIHRDLKPSNILVAKVDGNPVPKVIDFGLAKALENTQRLTDQTESTGYGQVLGTLKYMSPEQASLDVLDIDTRTDIYSLGVVLYQLLTGCTPLDDDSFQGKSVLSVLQSIRDEEPAKPSSRLSTVGAQLSTITKQRDTDSLRLKRVLAGDLDWIVMKALEKDRSHRYDSVARLSEDITNYLCDEPVMARPPSTGYRIQKFVRKHRVGVSVAALVGLMLVLGIAGTTWGLFRALDAEELARNREESERIAKLAALDEKKKAETALAKAETLANRTGNIIQIVTDSFQSVDPESGSEAKMSAKEVLFNARKKMDASNLDDQGKVDLLGSLTRAFLGLGEYESAISTAREEVEIRKKQLGSTDSRTLSAMNELSSALSARGQFDEALQLGEYVYETRRALLGEDDPLTLENASNLAEIYRQLGRLNKSIEMQEAILKVLENRQMESGQHSMNELMTMNNLATAYKTKGRIEDSIAMYEETLDAMESLLGEDHPQTLNTTYNLANAYQSAGQVDDALPMFEQVLDRMTTKLGANHPITLAATNGLATAYFSKGRLADAAPLMEKTADRMKTSLGEDHAQTIAATMNLAYAYRKSGQLDKAISSLEKLLDIATQKFGEDHPTTLLVTNHLAGSFGDAEEYGKSIRLYENALGLSESKLGKTNPHTMSLRDGLAMTYFESGQYADSILPFEESLEINRSKIGFNNQHTLQVAQHLAEAYRGDGQIDSLIPLLEELVEGNRSVYGDDDEQSHRAMHNLAVIYLDLAQFEKACPVFKELHELQIEKHGEGEPATMFSQAGVGASYLGLGKVDEGLELLNESFAAPANDMEKDWIRGQLRSHYLEARQVQEFETFLAEDIQIAREKNPSDSTELANALQQFGDELIQIGEFPKAVELLAEEVEIRKQETPDNWSTFDAHSRYGAALLRIDNVAAAKSLLLEGYDGLSERIETIPESIRGEVITYALKQMVELALIEGDEQAAAKWRDKIREYRPEELDAGELSIDRDQVPD